jgi:uncharacterized membrane protein YfcA
VNTVWLTGIVFLAFVVEATAGFGATVVAVTLAAELMPIPEVLATLAPVNFLLSAYVTGRHFAHIDRRLLLRRILPFMGLGMAGGIALFQLRDQGWLKLAFALFVCALSISELWRGWRNKTGAPLPPVVAGGTLVAAGVIHGLFACAGPLVVWVVGREVREKERFRATLSCLWLIMATFLIPSYILGGELTLKTLPVSAILLVPLGASIWVGEKLHHRIPERQFRLAVDVLLFAAAATLAIRSL